MSSSFNQLKTSFVSGSINKSTFIEQAHARFHSLLLAYSRDIAFTDISCIEITSDKVVMTTSTDDISLIVDLNDHRTAPIEAINFNQYEPTESQFVRKIAPHIDCMLDIGANIGWYSLLVSSINSKSSIYAFEPIPGTFEHLKQNCHLNNAININCCNYGFSSAPGSFPFYFYPEGSGNASMRNLADRVDADVIECQLSTINHFSTELPANVRCDFIKCDVEGNELFVLKGGLDFLSKHKPVLFLELLRKWSAPFGYHPNDVLSLLRDMGYMVFVLNDSGKLQSFGLVADETVETNYFFIHPESKLKAYLDV